MENSYCPDCDEGVEIRKAQVGQKLFCPHCGTELEVIGTDPLDLDWAYASAYNDEWEFEDAA